MLNFAETIGGYLMQTIDTYRLTSMEEPTDEVLAQLMHEAAMDAKQKGEEAHKKYFDQLREYAASQRLSWCKSTNV